MEKLLSGCPVLEFMHLTDIWMLTSLKISSPNLTTLMIEEVFNVDGGCYQGKAFGGGIARDGKGDLIFAFGSVFGQNSAFGAECLALIEGMKICAQKGLVNVIFETDSKKILDFLDGKWTDWQQYYNLQKIKLQVTGHWRILHAFREQNAAADCLVHYVKRSQLDFQVEVFEDLDSNIRKIINCDKRGYATFRSR